MNPGPGLETILSDSEARRIRCIDAEGHQLWEFKGGWTKRLTTGAALSLTARPGKGTLVIGASDGRLTSLDAETGAQLWQTSVGAIEWGSAIWADLDGDGQDEIVAGTESKGIQTFKADGTPLWTYPPSPGEAPYLVCPIAAADVDGDGRAEIFAADKHGPFCIGSDGVLRWQQETGDEFKSTVSISDLDHDGCPDLIACSMDDNAVWCFDARTGAVRWKCRILGSGEVSCGSSIALGDLDGDGKEEIVVSDRLGYVYCIDCTGKERWVFATERREDATPTLGDVDGDGEVDVLAACGDHWLYCLNGEGELKWRTAADLRLINPATICDVDLDGKTDILVCGSDRQLRCYTLDGRYREDLMPWPSRRFDPQQSGSSFGRRSKAAIRSVSSSEQLLAEGGFERAKVLGSRNHLPADPTLDAHRRQLPRGWYSEDNIDSGRQLDTETRFAGQSSVRIEGTNEPFVLASEEIPIERGLKSVAASIRSKGPGNLDVFLTWKGQEGIVKRDILRYPTGETRDASGEWREFSLSGATPPPRACWVSLTCQSMAGKGEMIWWDEASLVGHFERPVSVQPFINQVGYEIGAPKAFTVQANFLAQSAAFEVLDERGKAVHEGKLEPQGRIIGAYGNDWGFYYWRGDFSAFDQPGKYRVHVNLDGVEGTTWPFKIGKDLLWEETSRLAYRFFYYQRCGFEIPGYHKACHLDDAASADGKVQYDLAGGWHDAGDYNKYHNAPYVLGLATAYGLEREAFDQQDEDGNGQSDFLDEILWGGDCARRMMAPDGSVRGPITSGYGFWSGPELETDNIPNTGDERRLEGANEGLDSSDHTAAMAKIARYTGGSPLYVEAAQRGLKWALDSGRKGPLQLSALIDLYAATGQQDYADQAKSLFASVGVGDIELTRNYDRVFHEDHSQEMRKILVDRAEAILALAHNPFGVCTFGSSEKPNFFNTPADGRGWHVGTSRYLLSEANTVAQAYDCQPDPRYLRFIYDQFNWILGNNPHDISLMEGAGSANPPSYHHRYTFAGVPRGAVPGSVVNGITWRDVAADRPFFDMSGLDIPAFESNEVWLPHNTNYLNALANLRLATNK
jgi:outer membrane protein assembly factor BamB